ncbi:MAG: CHAT domain-containing protein [Chthoniobacter sp.]|nr:CHAT domain-containing protein [Chthoniobacter sp.]
MNSLPETRSDNPFTERNIVKDRSHFFGRARPIKELFDYLNNDFQSTSLLGERRVGKSSLLWHLCDPAVHQSYEVAGKKPFLFVFFDLQKVATLSPGNFLMLLGNDILEQHPVNIPAPFEADPSLRFTYLIRQVALARRIVVCLDEFDIIAHNDKFDVGLLFTLRSPANERLLAYIVSSRLPLQEVIANTPHTHGSDFPGIFATSVTIGALTEQEARELIIMPASEAGVTFTAETVDFLLGLAGRLPLFLKMACFYAFEIAQRHLQNGESAELNDLDRAEMKQPFTAAAIPYFESYWKQLSDTDQKIIAGQIPSDSAEAATAVRRLVDRGLLTDAAKPEPFCPTFGEFAREKTHQRRAQMLPQRGTPVSSSGVDYPRRGDIRVYLDIWISKDQRPLVNLSGAVGWSKTCQNAANWTGTDSEWITDRTRNLPDAHNWRLEKMALGTLISDIFKPIPEISDLYSWGRGNVRDEQMLITFRCPPELITFPLEFINAMSAIDGEHNHLVLRHPVRKAITEMRYRRPPLSADFLHGQPVRILLVASNTSGIVNVNGSQYYLPAIPAVQEEVEKIAAALTAPSSRAGKAEVHVLVNPSAEEFVRALEEGEMDMLHYSGHGFYVSQNAERSSLFFRRPHDGGIDAVTANDLHAAVDRSTLRFVYLSCCQGGENAPHQPGMQSDFMGIAHSILSGGVPSVLAMRWPVKDGAAATLALEFYKELLSDCGIELALMRARKVVHAKDLTDHTWLSPILVVQGN